ncbi:MAG: hypothetical protein JW751_12565 [Polyangiaceae bacterium]|nr:hypothetical protein [Polyangiaceae bacterium]
MGPYSSARRPPAEHEARVGPLLVHVRVDDPISELVSRELGGETVEVADPRPDLRVTLLERETDLPDYEPRVFSAKGRMHFGDDAFFVGYDRYFKCLFRGAFDRSRTLELFLIRQRRQFRAVPKTAVGYKSTVMTYQFFWLAFQLALLKRGGTFLHAGIYTDDGTATAITGTGGCGKTSCLFRMLQEHPTYRYLSEDFGIITDRIEAHFNPKFVSIYRSDTRQHLLRDYVLDRLPLGEKPYWYGLSLLRANPRVKAAPREVLGPERIAQTAQLSRVVYLIRGSFADLEATRVGADELAERCLNVTLRELKSLTEVLHLMNANRVPGMCTPTVGDWAETQRQLYREIFAQVTGFVLAVPRGCPPEEVCAYLERSERLRG